MYTLRINAAYPDCAVCLVRDGIILADVAHGVCTPLDALAIGSFIVEKHTMQGAP